LEIDPTIYTAWNNKGVIFSKMGRYNNSLSAFDKAIELNPKYKIAWFSKGEQLAEIGKIEGALEAYNTALEIDPDYFDALYDKGKLLLDLDRYDEAFEVYEKASKIRPKDKSIWAYKGVALGGMGRYNESISAFDTALELDYYFDSAWCNKGITLVHSGDISNALDVFNKALEVNPKNACAWNKRLGVVHKLTEYTSLEYRFYENYSINIPVSWWMIEETDEIKEFIKKDSFFSTSFHGGDEDGTAIIVSLSVMKEEPQDLHENAQMYVDAHRDYTKEEGIELIFNEVNKTIIAGNDVLIEEYAHILENNRERYGIIALVHCSSDKLLMLMCNMENHEKFQKYKPTIHYVINSVEC